MKTVRNVGLLTAAAALAFTFTPVFGFSRANADDAVPPTEPTATQGTQTDAASPGNASTTGTSSSGDPDTTGTTGASTQTGAASSSSSGTSGSGSSSQDTSSSGAGTASSQSSQPVNTNSTTPTTTTGSGDTAAVGADRGANSSGTTTSAPAGEAKKPTEKENVTNPYYLTAYEEDGLVKKLKDANPGADVKISKGKATLTYSDGTEKFLEVTDLVRYKYRADNSYGDKPELPRIYNSWDITSYPVDVDLRENRELQFFRGETCPNSTYTVKLENAGAKGVDGVSDDTTRWSKESGGQKLKIFANSVAYLKKNSDGTPYVKIDGLPQGISVIRKPGQEYSTGYAYNPNPRPAGQNSNVPKPDDQPYQHWGFKLCGNPVAFQQTVEEKKVEYTVFREGEESDYTTGTMYIGIIPLKEKYDPQRNNAKNSVDKPFVVQDLKHDLTEEKIKSFLDVKYAEKAKDNLSPEPKQGCTVGGKLDCFTMKGAKPGSLPDGVKLEIVGNPQLTPGLATSITVRVIYPDNQTGQAYLKGNPDGDSVDYVDLYVKLPVPLTPAQPAPSPNPQPAPAPQPGSGTNPQPNPQPDPNVNPGGGNDTPGGSYVPVNFDPKGDGNPGGGGDKPAPHEPETKKTPNVTETPSSGTNKVKDPDPTPVEDPNNLTPEEKQKVREAVKKSNPNLGLDDDKIHIADNGEITIFLPDDSVVKIPPVKGVSLYPNPQNPGAPSENQPVTPTNKLPNTGVDAVPVIWVSTALLLAGTLLTLRSHSLRHRRQRKH